MGSLSQADVCNTSRLRALGTPSSDQSGTVKPRTSDDGPSEAATSTVRSAPWGSTYLRLVDAVVDCVDSMGSVHSVDRSLTRLVELSVELIGGAEAGVTIAEPETTLRVAASSSERKRLLDQHQIDNHAGPSIEACRTGHQTTYVLSDLRGHCWPAFTSLALAVGYRRIHTIPLRLRREVIGALSIAEPVSQPERSVPLSVLGELATAATIGVTHQRMQSASSVRNERLQRALDRTICIEQAKGALSARLNISLDDSFELMRRYARDYNCDLPEVSRAILVSTRSNQPTSGALTMLTRESSRLPAEDETRGKAEDRGRIHNPLRARWRESERKEHQSSVT